MDANDLAIPFASDTEENDLLMGSTLSESGKPLLIFIGRGHAKPHGFFNIPLNQLFLDAHNVIFVDPLEEHEADWRKRFEEIDWEAIGLSKGGIAGQVELKIVVDYSSLFCGMIQHLNKAARELKRPFSVYVPKATTDHSFVSECKLHLDLNIFTLISVHARFPVFDWSQRHHRGLDLIDPAKYIVIKAFHDGL